MPEEPDKGSFTIVYEEQEPRPTLPVSGAFGGPLHDGSLVVAHVYAEFGTIPALEEHDVQEGGVVDLSKGHQIKRGDLTRKVLATLVLSPEAAEAFGKWLADHAQKALAFRGKKQP